MDNGLGRAEYPLVGIASLDPHPRLVAGHDLGASKDRKGILPPGGKDRRDTLEHVHQRALTELQAEHIGEDALQPFIGKELVRFEIKRQRMDSMPERRALRRCRQGRCGRLAACRAATFQPPVAPDDRLDLGKVDLVIFPRHRAGHIPGKWQPAVLTMRGAMVFVSIGRFGQNAGVPLMAGPGTARPRTLPLRLPVRRWRLRRGARCLVRALHPQHQIDQLRLRKPFEFLAIHGQDESQPVRFGKGWVITATLSHSAKSLPFQGSSSPEQGCSEEVITERKLPVRFRVVLTIVV
jgi:hypothetical protein